MLLTPIYLSLEKSVLPSGRVYTQFELENLTKPVIVTSYFIRIYPPNPPIQQQNLRYLPYSYLQFNIPTSEGLEGKIRLQLAPSISYGVNYCYRVEYWKFSKPYFPTGSSIKAKPTNEKVREEYWSIPTPDGHRLLDYDEYSIYQPRWTTKNTGKVILTKGDEDSLLSNLDIISIQSISHNSTPIVGYQLFDTSLTWIASSDVLDPPAPVVALDFTEATPSLVSGDQYEVTYILPQRHQDILFTPSHNPRNSAY